MPCCYGPGPHVPVDYGDRDSKNYWYINRMDPNVQFTEEACLMLINVPRKRNKRNNKMEERQYGRKIRKGAFTRAEKTENS